MNSKLPAEETGTGLALAIALWASIVTLAATEGVLGKLSGATLAALALAALAYAPAMYLLDRQLRAHVLQIRRRFTASAWLLSVLAIVAAMIALALREGPWIVGLAQWPFAIAAYLAAPLAAALSIAELERGTVGETRRDAPLRSPAVKSPGGHPAAT